VRFDRAILLILAAVLMSGCHMLRRITDCHRPQEYQHAAQLAPLKVPPGLESPSTQGALVIPTVEFTPPPPGPHDACLDAPPRYRATPPGKAASG
jgi:uncharacterized lipoprotein